MANSDIENCVSDFESSPRISACNPGPVRDLKSFLSFARQDRAPLESSNTSNFVYSSNQGLHAASTKKRQGLNGRTAEEQLPTACIHDGDRPCGDVSIDDADSRQRHWDMLTARLDDDGGSTYAFHDTATLDSKFDRQTVESVQDSFRKLCAPRQLDRSNFFEGIIDVDREIGFGEDEDFERLQNEFGIESCKSSEFHPTTLDGKRSPEEGREEGHLPDGLGVILSNSDTWGEDFGLMRERKRKFARSRSSIESGRRRSDQLEDVSICSTKQKPAFLRSLSNHYLHFSSREGEKLNSERFKLDGDSSVDCEEPESKEWMPTKLDSGEMQSIAVHLETRDRDWEMENRDEGQANDEDEGIWKQKVRIDEQEENGSRAGQDYTFESESEDMEDAIQDMLAEMRQENSVHESEESTQEEEPESTSLLHTAIRNRTTDDNGNPYSLIFLGFEDLLREADGRAERERKTVEDVIRVKEETEEAMRQQQMRWTETEKQMQSQVNLLEIQHARLLDMIRGTEAALTVEKERRKESKIEVDRILDMLQKERKSSKETVEKLSTCVNSLMKLRGNLAVQKSRAAEGGPSYLQVVDTVLEDMDRELQMNLSQWTKKSTDVDYHSSDLDELTRWKQQRDALEEERDKVEENMTTLLRSTRERHEEMEAVWLERETLMEQKVGCLEVELQHSEMKQRRNAAEILAERVRWAEELQKHRKAWARERIAWESTLRELEVRLGNFDCLPPTSERNCLIVANGVNEGPVQDSSAGSEYVFREMESNALEDGATERTLSTQSKNSTFDDKLHQFCLDVGNLALGIEAGVDKATDDLRSRESQWEMERLEWKELEECFKREREEMQKRVLDAYALMDTLKMEMTAKEAEMEAEKKQVQGMLMQKVTEVEKLNSQLKSKEHDMEVTVQKFIDEVRLIDKEVEKERKEREQVMELHFASKRKVITEMKEREEKWDLEIESIKQELDKAKMEVRQKEKEIEELKRSSVRAPSDRERQLTKAVSTLQHEKDALAAELSKEKGEVRRAMEKMLADVWKVCEEEQIQAAVAKRLGPGENLSVQKPMWESLWLEYCRNEGISDADHKFVEWEFALGKIARFEMEISEAKSLIDALRNELKMKGDQLLEPKAERERIWEAREKSWADEREKLSRALESEQQKGREVVQEWQKREQELIREKEAIEKSFKVEQAESVEAISNLQGVVRELEWVLKQSKSPEANHEREEMIIRRGLIQPASKSTDLVKVHASYLEEVDRYILELEAKMEAADKNLRSPEIVLGRKWGGDPEMNLALMKIERELFSTAESKGSRNSSSPEVDRSYFSPHGSRDWDASGIGATGARKRMPHQRVPRTLERNMCLTLNGLATLAQDTWADGGDEHLPLWQLEDRNSMASWMSPSSTEDVCTSHELPAHGVVTLPTNRPFSPSRRQQKWVVDVSWLEQVRKEHAWLRQQLEIERQRVAALGQVEADNRWIEAAIVRALELKRESDSKVADMQRKVNVMEVLVSKNPICSSS